MNKNELSQYIAETYNTDPDYPWASEPEYMVFRHSDNRKWFALIMTVPGSKLGSDSGTIDIINLKCDPIMTGSLRSAPGIFPAYHMNKENWISAALDGSVPDEMLITLLDISFQLTAAKHNGRRRG